MGSWNENLLNNSEDKKHWFRAKLSSGVTKTLLALNLINPSAGYYIPFTAAVSTQLFTACGDKDWPIDPNPIEKKDTTPPKINIIKFGNVDVTWWKKITVKPNQKWYQIYIWDELVAEINDEESGISEIKMYIETKEWKKEILSWDFVGEDCVFCIVPSNGNKLKTEWRISLTINAPEVKVQNDTVNVFFWWKIEILGNSLKIWWDTVASWERWNLVSIVFEEDGSGTKRDLKSWDNLVNPWTLWLTVKDKKETTIELHIDNRSIEWLESLENLDIKAGQTINLRDYIKPVEWCEISDDAVLVPEKWEKQAVKLSAFSVDKPWNYVLMLEVFKQWDENLKKTVEVNMKINAEDYTENKLPNADLNTFLPWYNKLPESYKKYFESLVKLSMISNDWYSNPKKIHVVAWENLAHRDWSHGREWAGQIKHYTKSTVIWNNKLNSDNTRLTYKNWAADVASYAKSHPDEIIMISCAITGYDESQMAELFKLDNVLVCTAIGDFHSSYWNPRMGYCQGTDWNKYGITRISTHSDPNARCYEWDATNQPWKKTIGTLYSGKNNRITVLWLVPWNNCFAASDQISNRNESLCPVWYPKKNWYLWNYNTVIGMPSGVSSSWDFVNESNSSYPAAVVSAMLWNMIDIIKSNNPELTISECMDIINNYLGEERFYYVDDVDNPSNKKKWWIFYVINWDRFIEDWVLHINELKNIDTGSDVIDLPSYKGVCYTWKWVWFWIGKTYYWGLTKDNINYLLAAWGKGESVTWTISKSMWDSQWWRGNVGAISVSKKWEKIYEKDVNLNNNSSKIGKRKVPGNKYNMWGNNNDKDLKKQQKYSIERYGKLAIQRVKNSRNGK